MRKLLFAGLLMMSALISKAQEAPKPDAPKADTLQQYTGKYVFPEGSVVTEINVALENGVMSASSAMGTTELKKQEGDVFEVVVYSGTATFKRNADNKIVGVTIVVGDITLEGKKADPPPAPKG